MNEREIIKTIMDEQEISNAQLAKRINVSNAAIWDRLNNKNNKSLSISTASQMLNALDYKLVVVPADKVIKGGYEL